MEKQAIQVQNESSYFTESSNEQIVWMSHGDLVVEAPEGLRVMRQVILPNFSNE